jgi:hypothetical protein
MPRYRTGTNPAIFKPQSKSSYINLVNVANAIPVWELAANRYRWIPGDAQDVLEMSPTHLPGRVRVGEWIRLTDRGPRRVTLILVRHGRLFFVLAKRDDLPVHEGYGVGQDEASPPRQVLAPDTERTYPRTSGPDGAALEAAPMGAAPA